MKNYELISILNKLRFNIQVEKQSLSDENTKMKKTEHDEPRIKNRRTVSNNTWKAHQPKFFIPNVELSIK